MPSADVLSAKDAVAIARRAVPLLDLTDLSEACRAEAVDALCRTAREAGVAAVCVWPRFARQAAVALRGSPVRLATVVNFPAGGEDIAQAADEAGAALADGAREIDLVLPYRAFLRGDETLARDMVAALRDACGRGRTLKVILETGVLAHGETIRKASRLALSAGADFIKTSTGKSPVSATPEAAEAMLQAIRDHGEGGLKVSGGLRTVADAARYLALAGRAMGPAWIGPERFRFGASSLYAELAKALEWAP